MRPKDRQFMIWQTIPILRVYLWGSSSNWEWHLKNVPLKLHSSQSTSLSPNNSSRYQVEILKRVITPRMCQCLDPVLFNHLEEQLKMSKIMLWGVSWSPRRNRNVKYHSTASLTPRASNWEALRTVLMSNWA